MSLAGAMMMFMSVDLLFSFDTTGSMYPCLTQVRSRLTETTRRLFRDIPSLRIAVIAHGDYCDGPRAITKLDFSDDSGTVCRFIDSVKSTSGGDAPECYELVLAEARTLSWSAGTNKTMVLLGDEVPHPATDRQNTRHLDWKNELRLLGEAGIQVHAVQALNNRHATSFYADVARISGGCHLELHQFAHVTDLVVAVAYRQSSPDQFLRYEQEVQDQGRMNRSMSQMFETLSSTGPRRSAPVTRPRTGASPRPRMSERSLEAVHPSRFQVMEVRRDTPIADYVSDNGLSFRIGRGFYQFTKPVKVQDHKEVILVDKFTGDMFSGAAARRMLKLPTTGTVGIKPDVARDVLRQYDAFIQSTSPNRKLIGGTKFLYDTE